MGDTGPGLSLRQLKALIEKVFRPGSADRGLLFMLDIPRPGNKDNLAWAERRKIAAEWFSMISMDAGDLPFTSIQCCSYFDVGSNNNDLPEEVFWSADSVPDPTYPAKRLTEALSSASVVMALTEFSATAPLKNLAHVHGFRGASMPGFHLSMIPALALDVEAIHERVSVIKTRLDKADSMDAIFEVGERRYKMHFDLRFRSAHASSGLLRENGVVGNLPSGEAYIVPYEGENPAHASETSGELPVQFGKEVVVYDVRGNRAVRAIGEKEASRENEKLTLEPSYGNIAEVGIGVLGEWGIQAVGSTLLDEKLGFHVAFGRSDHFGGAIGPSSFRHQSNVVHIDRVYVPSVQPLVDINMVTLQYGKTQEQIMEGGRIIV